MASFYFVKLYSSILHNVPSHFHLRFHDINFIIIYKKRNRKMQFPSYYLFISYKIFSILFPLSKESSILNCSSGTFRKVIRFARFVRINPLLRSNAFIPASSLAFCPRKETYIFAIDKSFVTVTSVMVIKPIFGSFNSN